MVANHNEDGLDARDVGTPAVPITRDHIQHGRTFPREEKREKRTPMTGVHPLRRAGSVTSRSRPGRGSSTDKQQSQSPVYIPRPTLSPTRPPREGGDRSRRRATNPVKGRAAPKVRSTTRKPPDRGRARDVPRPPGAPTPIAFELAAATPMPLGSPLSSDGTPEESLSDMGSTETSDSQKEYAVERRESDVDNHYCGRCRQYEAALVRLEESVRFLNGEVKASQDLLKEARSENKELTMEVQALQLVIDERDQELDDADMELEQWRDRSQQQESEVLSLETKINLLNEDLVKLAKKAVDQRNSMSLKEHDMARPNVQRVQSLVKVIKEKNLKVVDRGDWPALKSYLEELAHQEAWPPYLLDTEGDEWDPSVEETALDKKLRTEMYMVLRDAVDWKKHGSKMTAVLESEIKHNGQALFRRLDGFFALGRADGDVQGAGVAMRQHTMASSRMNVVDYGLELERLVKTLHDLGLPPNIRKEVIPQYLNGLLRSFDSIRTTIDNKLEDDESWDPTLRDVMDMVERRANKKQLLDLVSKGKEQLVSQNSQETSRSQRRKQARKAAKVRKAEKVAQKKSQLSSSTEPATTNSASQNSFDVDKPCSHGAKCWLTNCKFKHAPGHKPGAL